MNSFERVRSALASHLGVDEHSIKPETALSTLFREHGTDAPRLPPSGALVDSIPDDSLSFIEFLMVLEEASDLGFRDISDQALQRLFRTGTVQELADAIEDGR